MVKTRKLYNIYMASCIQLRHSNACKMLHHLHNCTSVYKVHVIQIHVKCYTILFIIKFMHETHLRINKQTGTL